MLVFDVYFHFEDYKAVRREMMTWSIPNRKENQNDKSKWTEKQVKGDRKWYLNKQTKKTKQECKNCKRKEQLKKGHYQVT